MVNFQDGFHVWGPREDLRASAGDLLAFSFLLLWILLALFQLISIATA